LKESSGNRYRLNCHLVSIKFIPFHYEQIPHEGNGDMSYVSKYPSQFSDRHNYGFSEMWINEIHLILEFGNKLDQPRLNRALRLLIDVEPLLSSRFVNHWLKPYWLMLTENELISSTLLDVVDAIDDSKMEDQSDVFFRDHIDLTKGPQIKALLISGKRMDRLILKIQHLMCDAAGFKELLNLLSDIYTRLGNDIEYVPSINKGSRSLCRIYNRFSFKDLIKMLWYGCVQLSSILFPVKVAKYSSNWNKSGNVGYVFKRFSKDRFLQVKQYAQQNGVTINDLFSCALLRAMAKQINPSNRGRLRLMGTVDLRRYLPGRKTEGLCQASSLYAVNIKTNQCSNHDNTLAIVKKQMDDYKKNYIGLGPFLIYWIVTKPYPFIFFNWAVRLGTKIGKWIGTTSIGFTNLGLIDNKSNDFGPSPLLSAEMTCPGSIPPLFICALSGFGETLTLNAGVFESSIQKNKIKELFDLVDQELTA
jgi:NRPS condensation-like uncharacterized protein